MYCQNCGAEIKKGQKFCGKCGAPTDRIEESPPPQKAPENEENPPQEKHTATTVALVATAVIVLAVIILIAVLRSGTSAEEVTEDEPVQSEVEETPTAEEPPEETPAPTDSLEASVGATGVQIETIRYCDEWDWLVEAGYENMVEERQLGMATLYNSSDTDCTITLSFEYQVKSMDEDGDLVTDTMKEAHSFDIAAKDTVQAEFLLDHARTENDTGQERTYTYTGQAAITDVTAYTGNAKLLPLTAITDAEMTNNGGELGEEQGVLSEETQPDEESRVVNDHANILFTIPNETEDRWYTCQVYFDVYYDGVFVGTGGNYWWSSGFLCADNAWIAQDGYIRPGENALAIEDFGSSTYIDTNKISLVVKNIYYQEDTEMTGTEE